MATWLMVHHNVTDNVLQLHLQSYLTCLTSFSADPSNPFKVTPPKIYLTNTSVTLLVIDSSITCHKCCTTCQLSCVGVYLRMSAGECVCHSVLIYAACVKHTNTYTKTRTYALIGVHTLFLS